MDWVVSQPMSPFSGISGGKNYDQIFMNDFGTIEADSEDFPETAFA
jgi:hypothetical protein